MAKGQFKKPNPTEHKKGDLKKKDKFAEKLKDKLKSAIYNQNNTAAKTLITEAKTQKSNAKFNIPSAQSTSGFKPKADQAVPKPQIAEKKSKSFNKTAKSVKENGIQNGGQQQLSGKDKTNQKNKNNQSTSKQSNSNNVNGSKPAGPSNENMKQKKKKKKKKKKQKPDLTQSQSTAPISVKSSDDQHYLGKVKRKVDDAKVNQDKESGKKRLKVVGGFVETNANDEVETKLVYEKLKKKKEKKKSKLELKNDANAPKIKVHKVEESKVNGTGSNSDSEADSYIDKFFGDGDENFDENHIYSLDEIQAKDHKNGFLSKASGDVTESDVTASSEDAKPITKKNKKKQQKPKKKSSDLENSSPKNKLVKYEGGDDDGEYDFDEYMWPEEDEYDSSDDSHIMYGSDSEGEKEEFYTESDNDSDSEISFGSEVDSDDTYECESSDVESMDEYDDYEDHSSDCEHDHSDCSGCSEEMSDTSGDTYDDFMNSRRYDDDHSSDDDHEYKSEF